MFKKENFDKIITNAEANIKFIGLLGLFGFPAYYFVWHNLFPQAYENLTLRLINAAMFMPYIFYDRLTNNNVRRFFPLYFCITLTICLPYSFSFMLLKNHFSVIWTMSVIAQTYLLIILVSDWEAFIAMTFIGITGSCITLLLIDGKIIIDQFRMEYLPIFGFTLASGIISIYKKDEDNRHKMKMMKSIAGSIAHEVRNPLNSISLIRSQIEFLISKIKFSINENTPHGPELELIELTSKISHSIKRANEIINITLNDLRGEKINSTNLTCLKAKEFISLAIKEYGYENEIEKEKVINQITDAEDFIFKGDEALMIYIIFNLIKNALYYIKSYPNSVITISSKIGESHNFIYVHDTGPGIAKNITNKIFGDFVTSGKEGGTGLGLAFCKRTMEAIGGDISCESEVEKYTKFILSFPKTSPADCTDLTTKKIPKYDNTSNFGKKVLLVDDNKTNLTIQKNALQKNLGVECDLAENGYEALELLKNKRDKYDLILMDLEMPIMNGFKAIAEIRKIDSIVPIIAYSSLDNKSDEVIAIGANEYMIKPQVNEVLSKTISKWINVKYNPLQNKTKEEILTLLQGKQIIIADDEDTNLMMLSKYIENYGVKVSKVSNGKELFDEISSDTKYALIITDINMPIMNGKEVSVKIRKYEREKKLAPIPIIAFTGNDEKEKIHHLFTCGINDYFVKGNYDNSLIKTIGFWILNPPKSFPAENNSSSNQ